MKYICHFDFKEEERRDYTSHDFGSGRHLSCTSARETLVGRSVHCTSVLSPDLLSYPKSQGLCPAEFGYPAEFQKTPGEIFLPTVL